MEFRYHLAKEQIMNVFVMEDFFKKNLLVNDFVKMNSQ